MSKQSRASRRAEARAPGASGSARRATRGARPVAQQSAIAAFVHVHGIAILAALILLNLLFALLTFMPQPHTGGDSANYLTLARSLLQRHSYTDLYDPIQPPHTKYPPVFPLMLAT